MHDKNAAAASSRQPPTENGEAPPDFWDNASCSLHRIRTGPPSALPFARWRKVALILPTLLNASARCTRDLGLRKVLDDEVFALRQELTEHSTHRAGELEAAARGEMQPDTEGAVA